LNNRCNAKIIVDCPSFQGGNEISGLWRWICEGNWAWGLASPPGKGRSHLNYLKQKEITPIITSFLAHPESRQRFFEDNNMSLIRPEDALAPYFDIFGNKFIWEGFTEEDSSGVGFSRCLLQNQPSSHKEAEERFEQFLREGLSEVCKYAPNIHKWGRCGYASSTHTYAKLGLDCVLLERANDDVDDLQTGIAFLRGAGKQYGCSWGVDFSLWWGVFYGCVQNLPCSYHRRNWLISYFSGADYMSFEGGDLLCSPEGKLSVMGSEFEAFSKWISKNKRGVAYTPVAVILPSSHGWITPPYWETQSFAWNYARLRREPGEKGIDGFFGMCFPGSQFAMDPYPLGCYEENDPPSSPFALSCITPRYAPSPKNIFYSKSYIPFGKFRNRKGANRFLNENRIEPAPYRPMGVSRWGDIFDVFTDEVNVDVLNEYKVVVVLGPLIIYEEFRKKLLSYVNSGGILIHSAGTVGPDDYDWLGIQILPELHVGYRWQWEQTGWINEAFRYVPSNVDSQSHVLAWANKGSPLVVCSHFGKGQIYTCLVPWFESPMFCLAGVAVKLFDFIFNSLIPISIEGPPCEWLVTSEEDSQTIILVNHADFEWEGSIRFVNPDYDGKEVFELFSGTRFVNRKDTNIKIRVPSYDVGVFRCYKT